MVVTNRQLRWVDGTLWLLAALIFLASPVTVLRFLLPGPRPNDGEPIARLASAEVPIPDALAIVDRLDAYAVIWQRDLRQPPFEQVAAKSPEPAPAELPPLQARLLGTAMELERRFAIFLNGQGQLQVKREGEVLDGMTVATIEPNRVLLTSSDREEWLKLPERQALGATNP